MSSVIADNSKDKHSWVIASALITALLLVSLLASMYWMVSVNHGLIKDNFLSIQKVINQR